MQSWLKQGGADGSTGSQHLAVDGVSLGRIAEDGFVYEAKPLDVGHVGNHENATSGGAEIGSFTQFGQNGSHKGNATGPAGVMD